MGRVKDEGYFLVSFVIKLVSQRVFSSFFLYLCTLYMRRTAQEDTARVFDYSCCGVFCRDHLGNGSGDSPPGPREWRPNAKSSHSKKKKIKNIERQTAALPETAKTVEISVENSTTNAAIYITRHLHIHIIEYVRNKKERNYNN